MSSANDNLKDKQKCKHQQQLLEAVKRNHACVSAQKETNTVQTSVQMKSGKITKFTVSRCIKYSRQKLLNI